MERPQPGLHSEPLGDQWPVLAPLSAVQLPPDSQTSRKRRKGARVRMGAGFGHLFLGLILIVCGIGLVLTRFKDHRCMEHYNRNTFHMVDHVDRQVWPIWIGVIIMLNAVLGFLSKRSQIIISLYMACSIVCSVVSAGGLVRVSVPLTELNTVLHLMTSRMSTIAHPDEHRHLVLEDSDSVPYWFHTDYSYSPFNYSNYSFELSYYSSYNEWICVLINNEPFRPIDEHTERLRHREMCFEEENASSARVHIGLYSVVIACFALEFVLSVISASFTCVGLNCCNGTQRMQQVIYYQAQNPSFQAHVVTMHPNGPPPAYQDMSAPLTSMTAGVPDGVQPEKNGITHPLHHSTTSDGRGPSPDKRGEKVLLAV